MSYSIGQLFYEPIVEAGYYVSQGLQHPLVFLYTETIGSEKMNEELKVYPNPVGEKLYLSNLSQDYQDLSVELFDLQGRILLSKIIYNEATEISMAPFERGIYILKVYQSKREINTIKVLKR